MSRKKKNRIVPSLAITAYAAEGKSIGHAEDGKVIFVSGAVPGDEVALRITKDKKSWAEATIMELITPSPLRVDAFCQHFGICGGCKWQMLPYAQQLEYKEQQVRDQLRRIGNIPLDTFRPIIGSPLERFYRNKLEFTFSAHRYRTHEELVAAQGAPLPPEPALGFHAPGLFDKIVPIYTCHLQPHPTNKLLEVLREHSIREKLLYYNYHEQRGWLRNAVIRVATTGEVLVNIVLGYEDFLRRENLLNEVQKEIPEITSLHYTINEKLNDSTFDLEVIHYAGSPYITEKLDEFSYKISPKSFFQTNTKGAETLYRITRELAGLTGTETVYDLYCGTGSIGIFCSKGAKKVIGIEVIEEAIKDARDNAAANGLTHCDFYTGDVAKICTPEFFAENGRPDVIITDPPRAGMHEDLVQQLLAIRAPRIVYVSCNPATQARDLALLTEAYEVKALQPVDMFPHTHHVENVAMLELRA